MSDKEMTALIDEEPFASKLSFYKLVWIFVIGSIFGTWYEEILTFARLGIWENRSAVIIGPFNPLYGTAYVLAVVLFYKMKNPIVVLVLGAVAGGAFEYAANWAQEFFTGSVSWDYNALYLNINGRTTVGYSVFWGILILMMVKLIYPFTSKWIERIPKRTGEVITKLLIVFLGVNMLITYSMLIRQGQRIKGIEPLTPIGQIYDEVFTDNKIKELFPNMVLNIGDNNE